MGGYFGNECYPKKVACKIFNIFGVVLSEINPTKPFCDSKKGCGVVSAPTENDETGALVCLNGSEAHKEREGMLV